ncbi:hypothetical protein NQZ68_035344, partial [Dissostichus eleginoides]
GTDGVRARGGVAAGPFVHGRAAGAGVRARGGASPGPFAHGRAAGAGVRARCGAAAGCFVHGRAAGAGVHARCGAAAGCFVHGRAAGPPVTAPAVETLVVEPPVSRSVAEPTVSRVESTQAAGTHSITHTDTQVTQKADSEHTAARVAESVLEDVVMDEDLLRLPVKRKNKEVSKGSVAQKGKVSKTESLCSSSQPEGVTEDSEGSDSESFFDIVEPGF